MLRQVLTGLPVREEECVESESSNQVTVWATARPQFKEEVLRDEKDREEWEFEGEYVFMSWIDETGGGDQDCEDGGVSGQQGN